MLAAPALFDEPPDPEATRRFLAEPTHHLLLAFDSAGRAVGFVSGVETTHPDKAPRCSSTSSGSTSPHVDVA